MVNCICSKIGKHSVILLLHAAGNIWLIEIYYCFPYAHVFVSYAIPLSLSPKCVFACRFPIPTFFKVLHWPSRGILPVYLMAISSFFAMVSVGFAAKACLEAEEMEKFFGGNTATRTPRSWAKRVELYCWCFIRREDHHLGCYLNPS